MSKTKRFIEKVAEKLNKSFNQVTNVDLENEHIDILYEIFKEEALHIKKMANDTLFSDVGNTSRFTQGGDTVELFKDIISTGKNVNESETKTIEKYFSGLTGDKLNEELLFLVDNCSPLESHKDFKIFLQKYKKELAILLHKNRETTI